VRLAALLALFAGIALTLFLVVRAGLTPVATALAALGIAGLLVVVVAHLPIVALLGLAWWAIGGGGQRPGVVQFIWARAIRDGAAEALPFSQLGGYAIGARALSLSGADAATAGVSTLLDLVLELAAKIPYLLLGLALLAWLTASRAAAIVGFGVLLAALMGIAVWRRAGGVPTQFAERFVARWQRIAVWRERIAAALAEMTARRAALRSSFVLHFACWVLGAGETWLMFRLMHVAASPGAALVIDSLLGGVRALSFFVPGAIGVQEGGYVLLCGLFGLSPGAALAFSFARRARDILIAAPVLLSWQWREGRAFLLRRPNS
jgi:putative membrane protein